MPDYAIKLVDIGKQYKLYNNQADKVINAFGLARLFFWRKKNYQEFWALRNLNLEIIKGERIGIIGVNGAGKSTLLHIIIGNISPTEGSCELNGKVQALMHIGSGFHPEFTGRENVRASLSLQGGSPREISEKEQEIIDFIELDAYIDQPVKTYSAGMYTRLAFATATAIAPDILIIDEVLGAGDAYFASKCLERMTKLTQQSGASVIFVSHDLQSVLRLCNKCIWLDKGTIVAQGPSMEVVKAYLKYNQERTERRLRGKNYKLSTHRFSEKELDSYSDSLLIRFQVGNGQATGFHLNQVSLIENDYLLCELKVGQAQDINPAHQCRMIVDEQSTWSEPTCNPKGNLGRGLDSTKKGLASGLVTIALWSYNHEAMYQLRLIGSRPITGTVEVQLYDGDAYASLGTIESDSSTTPFDVILPVPPLARKPLEIDSQSPHWIGNRELVIKKVSLQDEQGQERNVFNFGETLKMVIRALPSHSGPFCVIFNIVIYRMDGVRVSCHVSQKYNLEIVDGEEIVAELDMGKLNLGNGDYIISPALYKSLDSHLLDEPIIYDLVDRSYEFKVVGCQPVDQSIFHHTCQWRVLNDAGELIEIMEQPVA